MNYKILKHHAKDCYALANTVDCSWPTPWSLADSSKAEYRDSIGRKARKGTIGQRWHRVRCNCTHCPAEVIVKEDHFLCSLPSGGFADRRASS